MPLWLFFVSAASPYWNEVKCDTTPSLIEAGRSYCCCYLFIREFFQFYVAFLYVHVPCFCLRFLCSSHSFNSFSSWLFYRMFDFLLTHMPPYHIGPIRIASWYVIKKYTYMLFVQTVSRKLFVYRPFADISYRYCHAKILLFPGSVF